ncbi:leucine-rich repeat domain-containing protein [uncultured Mameliella sp.]|uniref:leucine-rich repeat domain-containing protein n=1 Tax=uncultured Mameliella sp. TaxID=1447087 RepID=UPI002604F73E|nr:leucine-rich repeat domain-containing protein [uncultured Mameliella sp.]
MAETEGPEAEVREVLRHVKMNRRDGVSFLYLSNSWAVTALPEEIRRLDWITWMDLEGTRVADLSPLAPLVHMEKLDLRGTPVSDLTTLAGMTKLQNLFLEGTQVEDLSPLSGCTRLREIWLDGTGVVDLSPLGNCRALQSFSIRGTAVADLSPLAGLPELTALNLDKSRVEDLSPVLSLPAFCETREEPEISFEGTPAAARDKALARIAEMEDPTFRARDLVDHLTGGTRLTGWRGNA